MGHYLHTYIGRPEVLTGLARLLPGARMRPLAQGLWIAPVTDDLREQAMVDADNDDGGPFERLVDALDKIGFALSRGGEVGWIETDFFGGRGRSRARLWRDGEAVLQSTSVNTLLEALGVKRLKERIDSVEESWLLRNLRDLGIELIKPRLLDAWDSVGLAGHSDTERCFERAQPVESWRP